MSHDLENTNGITFYADSRNDVMTSDVTIKVENAYSDDHESEAEYVVPHQIVAYALLDGIDQLWDVLWQYTGDGHGADDPDLGWWHQITITDAPDWPDLVGQSYENSGN